MPAVAIVTIALFGLLVVALALYLIRIALILHQVIKTLGLVTFGVRAIAFQTQPINPILTEIKGDVLAIESALTDLLAQKMAAATPEG